MKKYAGHEWHGLDQLSVSSFGRLLNDVKFYASAAKFYARQILRRLCSIAVSTMILWRGSEGNLGAGMDILMGP